MVEKTHEIISVPRIADGNPATAMALANSAEENGLPHRLVFLDAINPVINMFHRGISESPEKAAVYTDNSEAKRLDFLARAGGLAMFGEFMLRVGKVRAPARWNVVQEHQLLGAASQLLRAKGIDRVRLIVPDVFPKESGITAVAGHENATFAVWNKEAYEELHTRGFAVTLHRPFIVEGFVGQQSPLHDGTSLVVKSSGNGMPAEWHGRLLRELGMLETDWKMFTPEACESAGRSVKGLSQQQRLASFYQSIGIKTRLLIGYPSELVGVVADLRSRGVPLWMIALPPRGDHEKRNLEFAQRNGLLFGELNVSGSAQSASTNGVRLLQFSEIAEALTDTPLETFDPTIVGTDSIWD